MPDTATAVLEADVRAGSRVLSLFSSPLYVRILRAHHEGPLRLTEVREKAGWSAQTTVREALASLCDAGALVRPDGSSRSPTELTPAGHEMLEVADVLEAWLARRSTGPMALDSEPAKLAIRAMVEAWGSKVMWALAGRPYTLTELARALPEVSYPSLERRLSWLRATGQVEVLPGSTRGKPYVATEWLRRSVAPLCVAARCERRHFSHESGPLTKAEVEGYLLLALPLVTLTEEAQGTCMVAVQTPAALRAAGSAPQLAGVTVGLEAGRVASCVPEVQANCETWVLGTAQGWLDGAIDGRLEELRVGGMSPQLGLDLVNGLHFALFGDETQ